jgi:hypothetical protein
MPGLCVHVARANVGRDANRTPGAVLVRETGRLLKDVLTFTFPRRAGGGGPRNHRGLSRKAPCLSDLEAA